MEFRIAAISPFSPGVGETPFIDHDIGFVVMSWGIT